MANVDFSLDAPAAPQSNKEAYITECKENRSRCYQILEQAAGNVATDGTAFQNYLNVQSRFDRYSVNNALLIMVQKPDAKKLGDYGHWKQQGAQVKKQEFKKPVLIFEQGKEYTKEDGSKGAYYNAKKVYDISQTTKQEQAQPEIRLDDRLLLRAAIHNPPVSIKGVEQSELPEDKGALFVPEDFCIYVKKGMEAHDTFRCLTQELALAEFANGDKGYDCNSNLFHAYSVSYLLCKKYGVDTKAFQFDQVPRLFDGLEQKEVRGELSKIRDTAVQINSRMARALEQGKKSREQDAGR